MGNSRYLYKTIKTITGKFQPKLHCIQAENGDYITKPEDIAERWKEYCEELYNGAETEEHGGGYEREPPPLRSEIRRATRELSNGKSAGPDGVPAQQSCSNMGERQQSTGYMTYMRHYGRRGNGRMIGSIQFSYRSQKRAILDLTRTVALVAHASKIILRVILERIRNRTETEMADEQAGFRK